VKFSDNIPAFTKPVQILILLPLLTADMALVWLPYEGEIMKITGRSILLSLVLLLPTSLHAFKPNDTGHGGITRDALDEISVTINGETVKFTDAAKEEIKAANNGTDLSFDFFTPRAHFDDENLEESSRRIIALKVLVIAQATFGDGKEARKYLGEALHTIQDFFAHSNEPDEGLRIPNFGVDVLDKLPITTPTCTGTLFHPGSTLIPGAGLTTGYFLLPLCDVGLPKGKCIHGLGSRVPILLLGVTLAIARTKYDIAVNNG
jgi:hypothetical protein